MQLRKWRRWQHSRWGGGVRVGYGAHSILVGYGAHSIFVGYGAHSILLGYGAHSIPEAWNFTLAMECLRQWNGDVWGSAVQFVNHNAAGGGVRQYLFRGLSDTLHAVAPQLARRTIPNAPSVVAAMLACVFHADALDGEVGESPFADVIGKLPC